MGKIEYFIFDGHCFHLHKIEGVCKIRFTDNEGHQTILQDSTVEMISKKIIAQLWGT